MVLILHFLIEIVDALVFLVDGCLEFGNFILIVLLIKLQLFLFKITELLLQLFMLKL